MANGKVVSQRNSWFGGEGDVTTEMGEIQVLFHGIESEETNSGSTGVGGGNSPGIDIPDELNPFSLL